MKAKVLCLPFDPEQGFDAEELDLFCEGHELLSVAEHLIEQQGRLWWALLLSFREAGESARRRPLRPGAAPKAEPEVALDAEEQQLYAALRTWRAQRAAEEGVPPYMICTNRQLGDIVRLRPQTMAALARIPGLGEARCKRHGERLLAALAALQAPDRAADAAGEEGPNPAKAISVPGDAPAVASTAAESPRSQGT